MQNCLVLRLDNGLHCVGWGYHAMTQIICAVPKS